MIEITDTFLAALRKAIDETGQGQQRCFADKIGISEENVSRWLSGKVKSVKPSTWKNLQPHLAGYMQPDEKELLDQSKNFLTIPLIKVFERLEPPAATSLFERAQELLRNQEIESFVSLSGQEILRLSRLGVDVKADHFGSVITCSPSGLCWLFNLVAYTRKRGLHLTPLLLRELLPAELDPAQARELCVRMFPLSLPDSSGTCWQWTFYLNGIPPKCHVAELEDGKSPVANGFAFPSDAHLPFALHADTALIVVFKESETEAMKHGETIVAQFPFI